MGFFTKPKLWDLLSEDGKAWAKKVGNTQPGIVLAGVMNGDDYEAQTRIPFLHANYDFKKSDWQQAALYAAKHGYAPQLKTLLRSLDLDWFLSNHTYSTACGFLETLLEQAARAKDIRVWNVIRDTCGFEREYYSSPFNAKYYLTVASKFGFNEAARDLFDVIKDDKDGSYYGSALHNYCNFSNDDLTFALQWGDRFSNKSGNLAKCLRRVVEKGDREKTAILLDAGANPHMDSGRAMQEAIAGGHIGIIDLFIERGFRPDIMGREILDNIEADKGGTYAYAHFKKIVEQYQPKAAAAPEDRYSLAAADTLAERQVLPDGGSLTILFNFTLRQQMVLTDKANTIVSFEELAPAVVSRAYEKLVAKGGQASEQTAPSMDKPDPLKKTL